MVLRLLLIIVLYLASGGCGVGEPVADRFALQHSYSVDDPQFGRVMDQFGGRPSVEGNAVATFEDAKEIFPAMLQVIASATRSITFETFIFQSDDVGRPFIEALIERSRAGVKVHLLVDDLGSSKFSADDEKAMKEAGIAVVRYNPMSKVLLIFPAAEANHRTHRKLLVIDGRIGFTGGIGVGDLWQGEKQGGLPWRDTFYRVEGPVVAQMQSAFMDNWLETVGQALDGEAYFPELAHAGDARCQIATCSPQQGASSMELMYLLAINAAERTIDIATPYFIPGDMLSKALIDAVARGVRVRLVLPGSYTDSEIARQASKTKWDGMLEAGVEIHEYQPGMIHTKLLIVDGRWTSVGSTNLDPRSLRINDEANLNVTSEAFATEQTAILERDIAQSKQITEWSHDRRSLWSRTKQFFASLMAPQL